MTKGQDRRIRYVILYLITVTALAIGVWYAGYVRALTQLRAQAHADLELASDRFVSELQRYRMAAVLLADHPVLAALHGRGSAVSSATRLRQAQELLLSSVDKTAALTAFYAAPDGSIIASAHEQVPKNLPEAVYFRRALQGALGTHPGSSAGFKRRSYSFAAPSFGRDGKVAGVLVMVVDIENLEQDWLGVRPAVWFLTGGGRVFVSSRSEMVSWTQNDAGFTLPDGGRRDVAARTVGGTEIWQQDLSPYVPAQAVHVARNLPVINMRSEALLDARPAWRLAVVQAVAAAMLCLVFGSVLFLTTERRRALARANLVLEERVRERTQELQGTNAQLRREVSERQEAETALRRAQRDLVQAGKLSALGQMSAGISHELNQPLMAIQQFAENGQAFLKRGNVAQANDNLGRIGSMAARAARIIRNLRAFARNENEPMGRVDLVQVLHSALELTEVKMKESAVSLDLDLGKSPVWVRAGEVRLAQVFVNLINNAIDAMDGRAHKALRLEVDSAEVARVRIWDSGPGIADPDRIFEPFYSTKEVGESEGMGLGLSISYGLVQSFGGRIRGTNAAQGGAVFTVELDYWDTDDES